MSWNVSYHGFSMSKASCCWTIRNFRNIGKEHMSKTFSVNTKKVALEWRLLLTTCEDKTLVYLQLINDNAPYIHVAYELSILNVINQKMLTEKSSNIYGKMKSYACELLSSRNIFIMQVNVDCLTIYFDMTVSDIECANENSISKLSQDLEKWFINGKYYDVEFDVGGDKIRAHKSILAARSDVFDAMFEHGMKESKTNCVAILDIDHKVFKELLRFIYTDNAPSLDEVAHDLLAAADKYNVMDLKEMCEEALGKKLSVEMAAKTLILADLHICQQLKKQTIDFINAHAIDVMKTEGWQNMIKTYTHLVEELYRAKCLNMEIEKP